MCTTDCIYEMKASEGSELEIILQDNFPINQSTGGYRFFTSHYNRWVPFEILGILEEEETEYQEDSILFNPEMILERLKDQGLLWVILKTLDTADDLDPFNHDVEWTLAALNKVGIPESRSIDFLGTLKEINESY